jgi:hypothetical protein
MVAGKLQLNAAQRTGLLQSSVVSTGSPLTVWLLSPGSKTASSGKEPYVRICKDQPILLLLLLRSL